MANRNSATIHHFTQGEPNSNSMPRAGKDKKQTFTVLVRENQHEKSISNFLEVECELLQCGHLRK